MFILNRVNDSKIYNGITAFFYRGVIHMSMRVVTFKIEKDMLELVDTLSIQLKMNRSEMIRYMIQYYIDHEYTIWTVTPVTP